MDFGVASMCVVGVAVAVAVYLYNWGSTRFTLRGLNRVRKRMPTCLQRRRKGWRRHCLTTDVQTLCFSSCFLEAYLKSKTTNLSVQCQHQYFQICYHVVEAIGTENLSKFSSLSTVTVSNNTVWLYDCMLSVAILLYLVIVIYSFDQLWLNDPRISYHNSFHVGSKTSFLELIAKVPMVSGTTTH